MVIDGARSATVSIGVASTRTTGHMGELPTAPGGTAAATASGCSPLAWLGA
jgi:hypothetical protein